MGIENALKNYKRFKNTFKILSFKKRARTIMRVFCVTMYPNYEQTKSKSIATRLSRTKNLWVLCFQLFVFN